MKNRIIVILMLEIASIISVYAQIDSPVYNRLKQEYDRVVYYDHWGETYCYGIKKNEFEGVCDRNGKVIIPPTKYTDVSYDIDDNMFKVKIGDKEGLLDENGKVLIEADKYTYVIWYNHTKQYEVKVGEYAGVLDSNGRVLLKPTKYTEASYDYENKEFHVNINDKVGMLDSMGREIVAPIKGSVIYRCRPEGCFFITEWDKNHRAISDKLYTSKGKEIFSSKYPDSDFTDYGVVKEGLVAIRDGELWGYMDVSNGKMIIPAQYTSADFFENGMAKVSKGTESFLISNPLKDGGNVNVVSSLSLGKASHSDIDENIYETSTKQENTFAVIIANQNYSDIVVPYAINDGMVIRNYFQKTLGIPPSNIVYFEDATLNNMHSAISRLKDLADVYEGDMRIVFYYAGQGLSDENHRPYLMPVDASFNLVSTTGYSLESLYRELGNLNIESTVVLLDASFNNEDRMGKSVGQTTKSKKIPLVGKLIVLTASSQDETSFVFEEKGHSMFAYYFCKILQDSKGDVSIRRIAEYVSSSVQQMTLKIFKRQQVPQLIMTNEITNKNIKL